MKTTQIQATARQGLIVAFSLQNFDSPTERDDKELPEENDIPLEEDEEDPFTEPSPNIDEIDPDDEDGIDVDFPDDEDRIDRDPTIQPGTDPMKRDNSQLI